MLATFREALFLSSLCLFVVILDQEPLQLQASSDGGYWCQSAATNAKGMHSSPIGVACDELRVPWEELERQAPRDRETFGFPVRCCQVRETCCSHTCAACLHAGARAHHVRAMNLFAMIGTP